MGIAKGGYSNSNCFFMVEIQKKCGLELIKSLVDDKNLSRIYGFILYTDKDVMVKKVLSDKLYWEELDKKSGARWPIFSVRQLTKGHDEFMPSDPNGTSFMVKKWHEPSVNMDVLNIFEIKSTEELPCFVAFIWDNNDVVQSISVNINGRTDSDVYLKLEEVVSAIARAEAAVLPEYKKNVELFRNVKTELEGLNFKYKIRSIFTTASKFIPFFKLFV